MYLGSFWIGHMTSVPLQLPLYSPFNLASFPSPSQMPEDQRISNHITSYPTGTNQHADGIFPAAEYAIFHHVALSDRPRWRCRRLETRLFGTDFPNH